MVASLLVAVLLGAAVPPVAGTCVPRLEGNQTQGGMVIGQVARGCAVELDGRALRVTPDGRFVFGLGRDAPRTTTLVLRDSRGTRSTVSIDVSPRRYAVENVRGVPQATVTPPPAIAARIAREQAEVAAARKRDDAREDFRARFAWPLAGRISGVYGSQRVLNDVPKDPHFGLDIAAATGTPAAAPAPGVVTFARPDLYLTGGTVLLDHGHGVSSVFLHLSRLDVEVGQRIERGDVIGAVGMTGRASGPHLHWGMNWFDVRIDPQLLLPPR